jgi:hypothetical protein
LAYALFLISSSGASGQNSSAPSSPGLSSTVSGDVQNSISSGPLIAPAKQTGSPFPNDLTMSAPSKVSSETGGAVLQGSAEKGRAALSGNVSNWIHRQLQDGPLLLMKPENQIAEGKFGSVQVIGGSLVLILCEKRGMAVYNLHDTHNNAVKLIRDGLNLTVNPSEAAFIVTSSVKKFEDFNPSPLTPYRKLSCHPIGDDLNLYKAEFDITSFLHSYPQLRGLLESKEPDVAKTINGMLKTTAIMTQIYNTSDPYSLYISEEARRFAASQHK